MDGRPYNGLLWREVSSKGFAWRVESYVEKGLYMFREDPLKVFCGEKSLYRFFIPLLWREEPLTVF